MRFALTDDQQTFAATVRSLLDDACGPAVVRAAWDHDVTLDRSLWSALDDMGVLGLMVAEDRGGLGLDADFMMPILEECGRAAVPLPVLETALVAAPVADVPAGAMVATDLGGAVVANALDADVFLLAADDGTSLVLVPREAVSLEALDTVDGGRRAARVVDWDRSAAQFVDGANGTGGAGSAGSAGGNGAGATGAGAGLDRGAGWLHAARLRGALGAAAMLVGLGERMLTMTVEYVKEREQFGVPVGSFQALQHHLADCRKDLSFARPVVRRAGHSLATGDPDVATHISMAKAMASNAAELVGRHALQCHGAIGYSDEHDLHLYLKRAWALARAWGDADHHRNLVGEAIGV